MEKKSLYIRRLICTGAILCVFCVFVGVLVKVQLVDGEEYAAAANTASQRFIIALMKQCLLNLER